MKSVTDHDVRAGQAGRDGKAVKFRIERDVLADVVTWAARTLPSRVSAPALSGVLVQATTEGVSFTTTTQDTWSHCTADAVVTEPGEALITGRLLVEIARSLPAQPVSFALQTTGRVEVSCGASTFQLPTVPSEDFPPLPVLPDVAGSVDAAEFAAAVAQVAVASATSDDRNPTFSGIRMEIDPDGRVTLAATDRFRLAVRELQWTPGRIDDLVAVTVPGRELAEAAKALAHAGDLALHIDEGQTSLTFHAGSRRTGMRLAESSGFPKFRALLPSEFAALPEIEVAPLREALKRVSLVVQQDSAIRLRFSSDEVVLQAGSGDEAAAAETVACTLHGEPMEVAFNPRFLADGLAGLTQPAARLSLQSPEKAAVISGLDAQGGADDTFRYLLMPIRLR